MIGDGEGGGGIGDADHEVESSGRFVAAAAVVPLRLLLQGMRKVGV